MGAAIHLKNEREGITLRGLAKVKGEANDWRSCCWLLSDAEQDALLGGWLYLHATKSTPSRYGGRIIGFEPASGDDGAPSARVAVVFRADAWAQGRSWRGASHGMAWSGGVVEGELAHERDDPS